MNTAMPSYQRGLGLGEFIFGVFVFILLSITGLKLIPAYIEDAKIKGIFTAITHDPDMQKASPLEIQAAFDRRSSIDDITAIKANEIEVSSEGGVPYLSASYAVKVPLVANISFYIEFNPSSAE